MNRATSTILILIILGLGIAYFANRDDADTDTEDESIYANVRYGYSFEKPEGYETREYTPAAVAVGTPAGEGFDSLVNVEVAASGDEGGYESFDEFVYERGRTFCAADGPRETLDCDRITENEPFVSENGIEGREIYFNLVREDLSTRATTSSPFGPVYAFNIAANVPDSDFSALFIYRPIAATSTGIGAADIARSVSIDRVENR